MENIISNHFIMIMYGSKTFTSQIRNDSLTTIFPGSFQTRSNNESYNFKIQSLKKMNDTMEKIKSRVNVLL